VLGMGFGEIFVILLIALLVFGPERLPSMIKEAASFIRDLRKMVARARSDIGTTVGDLGLDKEDLELLADLRNPKSFIRQKVLDGADLGLDDPELTEALSLEDKPKPKPKPRSTARKPVTAAVSPAPSSDTVSTNGHSPNGSTAAEPADEPVPTDVPATDSGTTITAPPFDSDAT
jgi:Tat protein translocase TatB subunit